MTTDIRYFNLAQKLIETGYYTDDVVALAEKLERSASKRLADKLPDDLPEEIEDGKPITVVDSTKAFIKKA